MMKTTNESAKIDLVAGYVKYVLSEGTQFEKTRLL
jgi:hypothetical protein